MRLFALYLRHSKSALAAAVVLGVISGLATAGLLALINHVLEPEVWPWPVLLGFGTLCMVRLASGIGAHVLLIRLSQQAIFDLRMDLCDRILRSPLRRLERIGSHRLTACFADDVMSVSNAVVNLPYFFVNIVILIGCLVYLGWMSVPVFGGVLACFILGILSYSLPVRWATHYLKSAREHQDALFGRFGDVVGGVKELKLHSGRRGSLMNGALKQAADAMRRHNVIGIAIYATAANWNRLLFFVYVGLLIFGLPLLIPNLPMVALAGYVLVVLYMMAPLEAIQNALPHLARADVSVQKIQDMGLSLTADGYESSGNCYGELEGWEHINLNNISHLYDGENGEAGFLLGPLNLSFRRGEVVYLTGGNGSGKTTLIKLVTGLYAPDSGEVRVDGQPIDDNARGAYRQLFSAVFTDFHVFGELLGLDAHDIDHRAESHLRALRLDHKLKINDGRLSTIDLSRGQRKRLALLTAILEDRDFYVLDEWAADQDPAFRELFYTQIIPDLRKRGKTVLVVTHDDRYFHLADRQIKLEYGQLVSDEDATTPAPRESHAALDPAYTDGKD